MFSFMSKFEYTPYVTVPGSPRLEAGMSVLALLRVPEDWNSLVGWLDLETGELAAPNPNWYLYRLLFICGWSILVALVMSQGALLLQFPQALLWLLLASFWAIFSFTQYRAWRQTQAELKALQGLVRANDA